MSVTSAPSVEALTVDPAQGWPSEHDGWRSLAFIQLDRCQPDTRLHDLPPYPVIGLGNRTHPAAGQLDAVVEPPISADTLLRSILRTPHAAAITVQMLRESETLPLPLALAQESVRFGLLQASAEHDAWLAERVPTEHARAGTPTPGHVRVERHDFDLHVVLDRPAVRNAIDRVMRDQLYDAFLLASVESTLQVRLEAVGNVFSMGGDLDEFGTTRDVVTAHLIRSRSLPASMLIRCADRVRVRVQGACVGAGLEIAAFAKRVIATRDAWFQLPELSMGLMPGAGGCVSVPRRIGRQRAGLLMLSGRRINAATALSWGLIDAIEDQS